MGTRRNPEGQAATRSSGEERKTPRLSNTSARSPILWSFMGASKQYRGLRAPLRKPEGGDVRTWCRCTVVPTVHFEGGQHGFEGLEQTRIAHHCWTGCRAGGECSGNRQAEVQTGQPAGPEPSVGRSCHPLFRRPSGPG